MIELSNRAEPGIECICPVKRTLFNIVWNCISTTIICAWVSVHPNVPPSGQWKGFSRRLVLMFWSIIAPELILAWAVRQWYAAWEIRDTVNGADEALLSGLRRTIEGWFKKETPQNSRRWSMEHGHLLAMGGISTVDPLFENKDERDPRGPILTIKQYEELRNAGAVLEVLDLKLRKISETDIKDRSKADFLSKLIAILQTTWFLLQCIARGQQRLALTELELVTLALASLNAITYAFWWHKPLGVQEPMKIYFKTDAPVEEERAHTSDGNSISASYIISNAFKMVTKEAVGFLSFLRNPCQRGLCDAFANLFIGIPFALFVMVSLWLSLAFPLAIIFLLKVLKSMPATEESPDKRGLIAARIVFGLRKLLHRLTSSTASISEKWLREFLDDSSLSAFFIGWLFFLPSLFLFLLATTVLLLPFFTLLFLVSFIFTAVFGIITSDTVTPGASHVPPFYAPSTKSDKYSRMIVFAFFGVIFGGLHCIGWNFTYPTRFEQHLWRASSVAITAIPLAVAPIDYILEDEVLNKRFGSDFCLVLDLIMTVLLFIYVPARLCLIAQAFALLRNQPRSAFLSVDWTKYIPHIF